ncbi:MAG: D-alanine--D-alanine ligase, partial [Ruminococcus sp.]
KAYCLEANTLPGMTPTSLLPQEAAVEGMDYPTLCDKIVELSLEKYN